jgi:hypothetical protein
MQLFVAIEYPCWLNDVAYRLVPSDTYIITNANDPATKVLG